MNELLAEEITYPGVFCPEHIIFLIISIIAFAIGVIWVSKNRTNEKFALYVTKISAAILFIFIALNRIAASYRDVYILGVDEGFLVHLIPPSICGMSSLLLSLSVLLGKKDNSVLHFVSYIGFGGGFTSTVYPDYLFMQQFFDVVSITSLFHHLIMMWLVVVMLMTGYLKPTTKKWHYFPLGFCGYITFGQFLLEGLHFRSAMQIGKPLISDLPVFTSWYMVLIVVGALVFFLEMIFDMVRDKKSLKNIFSELIVR